ncbi:MAG TPA: hypothetical protein VKE22_01805 [Haliangiales bacterium]|nr:hypothetical protein [Haliangiales bacterium]
MTHDEIMARGAAARAALDELEATLAREEAEAAALAGERDALDAALGELGRQHAAARAAGGIPGSVVVSAGLLGILLTLLLYRVAAAISMCG